MGLIYDENPAPYTGPPIDFYKINANKGFLTHTYNLLSLEWIRDHTDDWREKRQCDLEIKIANRKIDYHRRHPNFIPTEIAGELAKLKKAFKDKDKE